MRVASVLGAAATLLSGASAQSVLGFNCGATSDTGAAKTQADFEKEFKTAQNLDGAPADFNTIRLYSNIQAGTTDSPIEAFPAAIATGTKLFLGIWASGTDNIDNELKALSAAVSAHGTKLTDLIVALSVGSEDMYRVSDAGIRAKAGVGNGAETIVGFIRDARSKLKGTPLANVPITHVDTWTAWVNTTNKAVIDEIDFLSVNAFPFYESENDNRVSNAGSLLDVAISSTEGVAGGKDVWVTETGWAYTGPSFGAGVATVDNAETYWQTVGCPLFTERNTFWYTLRDANPANQVKFAITDNLSTTPRFNISCPTNKSSHKNSTSGSSTSSGSTHTASGSSSNTASGYSAHSTGSANGIYGSNSTGSANGTWGSNSTSTGQGYNSTSGASQSTGAGSLISVSTVNSMAMVMSVVFALGAWAL
ncbi:glycoside hydrolase family 17 protein [Dothidotthia symphoricarpi CBS 119687]|uniref:Glycoside hydrolase family 17 protein n=1 Tax=Dothidotthia symphoricarpi CBS 119687 TaxID=1392245 RepID=A0A6A6AEY8_9PLEO|nr:glycoside hydrolase family 17 protein [Dothidotthia symphoricarpi CBS 119687]KAF2129675.1 glycoside hydrolase family 17 protein [Dothidotthia symphoricarpi CBS 119687]